jgi:hypothetical protein
VTLEPFDVLGNATRTPGSNPARYDLAKKSHQRRAEIFALPFNSKYLQKCN